MADSGTQREMAGLRKLIWSVAGALFVLGGSGFGLLWGANTAQDTKIEGNISRDVMIEYKYDNNREHDQINVSMGKLEDKVDDIQSDVSEMKGMLIELTK